MINNLNWHWRYYSSLETKEYKDVNLPHTNIEIPYNYFDEKIYQFVSRYEKDLFIKEEDKGKHLFLHFDGVGHYSKLYVNKVFVGEHKGGYDAFCFDIKDFVNYNQDNLIEVIVDSKEDLNIPPFGKVVDYMTYGGIYRDVYLDIKEDKYIEDVFIKTKKDKKYYLELDIKTTAEGNIIISIYDQDKLVLKTDGVMDDLEKTIRLDIIDPILWEPNNPHLYNLKVEFENDVFESTFGMRICEFKEDGFYINEHRIKLIGLNRHQSYPYIGYAAPRSLQEDDARILKKMGLNAVRTSHYPQSHYFINMCDKLGLLVFTEAPGWQHIGDEEWIELAIHNVEQMVKQYRNHPSIVLWGVRINESKDNHDFYKRTNEMAHKLDPTRQTGGVRCFTKMEELEDVYTYNDFISPKEKRGLMKKNKVVKSKSMPYLVSEFNGHMYPTKAFDDEIHRIEHLRRYARIMNEYYGDDEIVGLFGWCLFDYNTHKEFGSGDKICYHGVTDMFRNYKFPAYLYKSQQDKEDVLFVASTYTRGEYAECSIPGIYILTNCDSIKMYRGDTYVGEYTNKITEYPFLRHPPIFIDDFVGDQLERKEGYSKKASYMMKEVLKATMKYGSKMPLKYKLMYLYLMIFNHVNYQTGYDLYSKYVGGWGDGESILSFVGIKDGKEIKKVTLGDSKSLHLEYELSSPSLIEDVSNDILGIRLKVVDQNNNQCYFYQETFEIKTDDKLEIIGPITPTFKGGMGGTYLRTKSKFGKAKIKIITPFETKVIEIEIKDERK